MFLTLLQKSPAATVYVHVLSFIGFMDLTNKSVSHSLNTTYHSHFKYTNEIITGISRLLVFCDIIFKSLSTIVKDTGFKTMRVTQNESVWGHLPQLTLYSPYITFNSGKRSQQR